MNVPSCMSCNTRFEEQFQPYRPCRPPTCYLKLLQSGLDVDHKGGLDILRAPFGKRRKFPWSGHHAPTAIVLPRLRATSMPSTETSTSSSKSPDEVRFSAPGLAASSAVLTAALASAAAFSAAAFASVAAFADVGDGFRQRCLGDGRTVRVVILLGVVIDDLYVHAAIDSAL